MIDTLTDTLMALWNSTWRGKILPGLLAFIIVGICMSLFFLLIKSPAFLHQPSALNRSSKESGKSVSLALSPHHSGDVHATVVPTPIPTVVPTPTPIQTNDLPYPSISAPTPIQLPGIASEPGFMPGSNTNTGVMDIPSVNTVPTKSAPHTSIRHKPSPTPTAASVPPVVATPTATLPTPTVTAIMTVVTPTPIPSTPAIVITPTPMPALVPTPTPAPTTGVGATPTATITTSVFTPASTYPATPMLESSPASSATATIAAAVTPTKIV